MNADKGPQLNADDLQDLCQAVDRLKDGDISRRCGGVLERLVGSLVLEERVGVVVRLAQSLSPTARFVAIYDQTVWAEIPIAPRRWLLEHIANVDDTLRPAAEELLSLAINTVTAESGQTGLRADQSS